MFWGDHFDEVMAALMTSALRSAGWRTHLVGLGGLAHTGQHGVRLVADISLGEALRMQEAIAGIILPCPPDHLFSLVDPRIGELLGAARCQNALFAAEWQARTPDFDAWPKTASILEIDPVRLTQGVQEIIGRLDRTVDAPPS